MKKSSPVYTLVLTALFAALVTVGTITIQIPIAITHGYINFGDAIIFVAGTILGPVGGMVAGGIGSWLADTISGYAQYAPWTLVIKGLEGLLIGLLAHRAYAATRRLWRASLVMALAGSWMVLGYFTADRVMFDYAAAIATVPSNLVQAAGSVIIGSLLLPQVYRAWARLGK